MYIDDYKTIKILQSRLEEEISPQFTKEQKEKLIELEQQLEYKTLLLNNQ